jgi:ParB-like chromosome segregation protein Spo0J
MKISMPCLETKLVPRDSIVANNYNPNFVSPDKMDLLRQSIVDNGFCFPIVTIWDDDLEKYVIVDGFHRFTICSPEWLDIELVPVVVLEHDITKRLVATVQFNKARGTHAVDLDADLIRTLIQQGMTDEQVSTHLGIDLDTVHRYKQVSGVASLFANVEYSASWSMVEDAG